DRRRAGRRRCRSHAAHHELAGGHHPPLSRPVVHVPPDVARERTVPLKTRVLLALLTAGSAAVGAIPRHTVGEALCRLAGSIWYLSAPAARVAVRANLRHIPGPKPRWREGMVRFQHGGFNYWDTL